MLNRFLADSAPWNWLILNIAFKSTLLLLLSAALVMLLRRSSAALRHRIWALQFVALLLIVPIHALVPGLPWRILPDRWQAARAQVVDPPANSEFVSFGTTASMPTVRASDSMTSTAAGRAANLSMPHDAEVFPLGFDHVDIAPREANSARLPTDDLAPPETLESSIPWLPLIWLTGTLVALIPLVIGLIGNVRLRLRSQSLVDTEWQTLVTMLSDRLGLRRTVTLLLGGAQQMPMTFGLARPCVVLPSTAIGWSDERRQVVLLHELAHIKRCDVPLQLVARLATAVYWFHPLVWYALRQMRYEREQACDDCVLEAGQQAPDYASELLEIARAHRRSSPLLSAALSMARPSQLEGRLLAVLDMHRRRNQVSRSAAGQLILVALLLVACVGIVRPTLQAETPESTNANAESATAQDSTKPATQFVLTGKVLSPQGNPVPAASVEVIAYNATNWRRELPGFDTIDHYEAKADAAGQFRFVLPRDISRPRRHMNVIASAEGYVLNEQSIEPTLTRKHVEIKLHEPKTVRLQLIDTAGNPVANVQPLLKAVFLEGREIWIGMPHQNAPRVIAVWPRCSKSNEEGHVTVTVPRSTKTLWLTIDDQRVGNHNLQVDVADEPITVALKPARFLKGKVTAADTGKPIEGAELVIMEMPFSRVRTGADGSFRIAGGSTVTTLFPDAESIVHVYPPPDSPYLFHAMEWKWPNGGIGDAELSVAMLERGIVVEGQVVEKGSGKPVEGAAVYFYPQRYNNPFFLTTAVSRWAGSDMKYVTDAEGRFRMPVLPGPGYLLVRGPTLDFVYVELSTGDRYYGKPGLGREYHHGALKLNLEPDKAPPPLTIELKRGVTLRRKVVGPDSQPAEGKAFARSYLQDKNDVDAWLPDIPVESGLLEIPGFDPELSKPIFIVDFEHHCAATVSPTASEVDLTTPPIELKPCGTAKFRFVNDKGEALADYQPRLKIEVMPGAPATGYNEPDQPLWADTIIWDNIARPAKMPKTDADGRVTVADLIPDATYRVSFIGKNGMLDEGYEFVIRSGETIDVGEVMIPEHD